MSSLSDAGIVFDREMDYHGLFFGLVGLASSAPIPDDLEEGEDPNTTSSFISVNITPSVSYE